MKAVNIILALATVAQAHYSFPSIVSGGTTTTPWQYGMLNTLIKVIY